MCDIWLCFYIVFMESVDDADYCLLAVKIHSRIVGEGKKKNDCFWTVLFWYFEQL